MKNNLDMFRDSIFKSEKSLPLDRYVSEFCSHSRSGKLSSELINFQTVVYYLEQRKYICIHSHNPVVLVMFLEQSKRSSLGASEGQ